MIAIIAQFLKPYVGFALGAAYSLQQTLEGMGVRSSSFTQQDAVGHIVNGYWSPGEAMLQIFFPLFMGLCCLMPWTLAAGYSLNRKRGMAIALFVWLAPGLLSLAGWWPSFPWIPAVYEIGKTDALGSPWGMLPLAMLGLLTGWTLAIVLTDLLHFRERFWHVLDHAWYALAILTGLFFVWDSQTRHYEQAFRDSTQEARQASAYLLQQVKWYASVFCEAQEGAPSLSCRWSDQVQQKLLDYSTMSGEVYVSLGPRSIDEIYLPFGSPPIP